MEQTYIKCFLEENTYIFGLCVLYFELIISLLYCDIDTSYYTLYTCQILKKYIIFQNLHSEYVYAILFCMEDLILKNKIHNIFKL